MKSIAFKISNLTTKTPMPEDTSLGLHCFLRPPLFKDHICVNHRVVSQEGDYCITQYFVDIFSSVTTVRSRKRSSCVWSCAGINTGFVLKNLGGEGGSPKIFDSMCGNWFRLVMIKLEDSKDHTSQDGSAIKPTLVAKDCRSRVECKGRIHRPW